MPKKVKHLYTGPEIDRFKNSIKFSLKRIPHWNPGPIIETGVNAAANLGSSSDGKTNNRVLQEIHLKFPKNIPYYDIDEDNNKILMR